METKINKEIIIDILKPLGYNISSILNEYLKDKTESRLGDVYYFLYGDNTSNTELCYVIEKFNSLGMKFGFNDLSNLSKDCKIDVLEFLKNNGTDLKISENGENLIFKFLETSSFDFENDSKLLINSFNKLIELDIDFTKIDNNGRNIIHKAIRQGVVYNLLNHILSLDLDKNLQDNEGYTPLHFAAENLSKEQIEILIEFGADKSKELRTKENNFDNFDEKSGKGMNPIEIYCRSVGYEEESGKEFRNEVFLEDDIFSLLS